ncbi:MAG: hypothetical protein IKO63_03430 [Paludibacteraceae bacterium]|nr:hypothetical protein [Paludibacteraceae bacterium]
MAKAELDILLDKLSGRLTGDSEFYATHRYGRTVISNYPKHKDPKSITPSQRANSSGFGQRSTQAKQELDNPVRHAYWQNLYDQYKRLANKDIKKANTQFFGPNSPAVIKDKYYETLRGFVIAQLSKQQ